MFGNFRESIYFICIIRSVDMEQHQKVFAVYAPARYTVTRPDRRSSSHSIEIVANMWQPTTIFGFCPDMNDIMLVFLSRAEHAWAVAFGVSYIMIFMQEIAYVFVEFKYQKITTTTVFVSFYFLLDCIALSLFARELFHCRHLLICFDGVHFLE